MALFFDGPPANIQDLVNQDSGLLDVCRTEQIDATVKLRLAHEELAMELTALFDSQRTVYAPFYGQPRLTVEHLAATPPLKTWHTRQSLSLIYRDAYFNQLNDRFQGKWREYQSLANSAKEQLRQVGVGLVLDPLRRPASPTATLVPATETGGAFYFSITLLNARGEESCGAVAMPLEVPQGNAISLQLVSSPANATGWNAFVGRDPEFMYLQTDAPLAVDDAWVFYPSTARQSGPTPGSGQRPNVIRCLPRLLQRG